eukprot:8685363-Ditylum_brightwellii.AAC.1
MNKYVEKPNTNSILATKDWFCEIEWHSYVYKSKSTIATHAQEVQYQAAAICPPEEDDLDYHSSSEGTARNLMLETRRGMLVDYLDHMEDQMARHTLHHNPVSSEHYSKLQYERNSRILCVACDIDFSENGSIDNFDKVQSKYWGTSQYTLFMSISSWLLVDEWNKTDGALSASDEVTVEGE